MTHQQNPLQSINDVHTHFRYWSENWAKIGWLGLKNNPVFMLKQLKKYPWLNSLMKANELLNMYTGTRKGLYKKANSIAVSSLVSSIVDMVDGIYNHADKLVLHEDLVPPEILYGMGLQPWMAEFLGIVIPFLDTEVMERYIDRAENEGIPADICSLPKSTMGLALSNEMPKPRAIVASNMPCDGGMTSYTLIQKKLQAPIFRLDIPYNFYNEKAIQYFVGELRKLIKWLEEHTPGKMDWDRMKEICEERNRMVELQLEIWELAKMKPSPMAGEAMYLPGMLYGIALPGQKRGTNATKKILNIAKKMYEHNQSAVPDEKYRVILWNPPTLIFPDLFVWAEQKYGVAMLMDMLSFNRHPLIDTSSHDNILRGLAQIIMQGPMARHTRGPAENFFSDIFYLHEAYDIDMIWMAGHIGCKNTQALMGMFREKCRDRNLPLLNINYDLSDSRIVPPANIKKQVDEFMETVMQA